MLTQKIAPRRAGTLSLVSIILAAVVAPAAHAGNLTPPTGPVAPSMKTLDQVEARIPLTQMTAPGDASNVFIITSPGSYYLTGDVHVGAGDVGVRILADNVTLDLNGYKLIGAGASIGVADVGHDGNGNLENVAVTNGFIEGFSFGGVYFEFVNMARITDVQVRGGQYGVFVNSAAIVERCTVRSAQSVGIMVEYTGLVDACVVESSAVGYRLRDARIEGSVARGCPKGFELERSAASSCTAINSSGAGFSLGDQSSAIGCTVSVAGVGVQINGQNSEARSCSISRASTGVEVIAPRAVVADNTINGAHNSAESYGMGIRVDAASSRTLVEGNRVTASFFGIIVNGTNNTIVRNVVGGTVGSNNPTLYQVVAGNRYGAVVRANLSAGSLSMANSATTTYAGTTTTTTDPFANLLW